jgi:hypothetical protein
MAAPSMDSLSDRYAEEGVGSVFLYTHEAHPGEHYPHHTSIEQKLAHARGFRDNFEIQRQILVDALDGSCHRAYGSMPNMTWVFMRGGVPIYKSDWTDPGSVENALEYFTQALQRRRAGTPMVPFKVERLDLRGQDRDAFYEGLSRNGPKALREFREVYG